MAPNAAKRLAAPGRERERAQEVAEASSSVWSTWRRTKNSSGWASIVTILTAVAVVWMLVYFARAGARHPVLPVALGLLVAFTVGRYPVTLAELIEVLVSRVAGRPTTVPPAVENVVLLVRGGGSIEDLWAFNEERVARAIVRSPVPVVSAVGHETDVTIADFVADLRAPTPSAAAEMVVAAKDEFCGRIDRLTGRLRAAAHAAVQRRRTAVHILSSRRGLAGFHGRVALRGRHAAELTHALRHATRAALDRAVELGRQVDDPFTLALAYKFLGDIVINVDGDVDKAEPMLEESIAQAERLDEDLKPWALARALLFAG